MGRTAPRRLRIIIGACACLLAIVIVCQGLSLQASKGSTVLSRAWKHVSTSELSVLATFAESSQLKAGSRVLVETDQGLRMVGTLDRVETTAGQQRGHLLIFKDKQHLLHDDSSFIAYQTASDVAWVVQTLLPKEHIETITERLLATWNKEKAQLWSNLKPGLIHLIVDLGTVLKEEFPALIKSHADDIEIMGEALRKRAWEEHIEPVFVSEVWPLMEEQVAPVISRVGDEIIAEAPVWSLYWAYLRQRVSSDSKANHLQKRIGEFLSEKAVPIIQRHSPEFREAVSAMLLDTISNESVQRALRESVVGTASDPQFQEALNRVLEQWVLKSARVQEVLEAALSRPDVKEPLSRIMDSFERDVHHIANLILLNDTHDGINPDLARVLRNRLLREDEAWVLLVSGEGAPWNGEILSGKDGGTR